MWTVQQMLLYFLYPPNPRLNYYYLNEVNYIRELLRINFVKSISENGKRSKGNDFKRKYSGYEITLMTHLQWDNDIYCCRQGHQNQERVKPCRKSAFLIKTKLGVTFESQWCGKFSRYYTGTGIQKTPRMGGWINHWRITKAIPSIWKKNIFGLGTSVGKTRM